jgi:ADP-sugar diphosphatase
MRISSPTNQFFITQTLSPPLSILCSGVGFIKLKSHCTLVDENQEISKPLPGICFLRGHAVSILVALFCTDDNANESNNNPSVYSLLVEQPRIPIGQVSCLELPAGMLDDDTLTIRGTAVQELEEECGIRILDEEDTMVDLTELAGAPSGLPTSGGGSDEHLRCLYVEKNVTRQELEAMKGRLTGLREHGEVITLRVVPMEEVWSLSMDMKAMVYVLNQSLRCVKRVYLAFSFNLFYYSQVAAWFFYSISSLFLLDKLRSQGKIPPAGGLATPLSR